MTTAATVEGTAEEITDAADAPPEQPPAPPTPAHDEQSTALARPDTSAVMIAPEAEARELVKRLDLIRDAMRDAMTEGVDYGRIPGVDKPALFKPGAEKLGVLFRLDIQPVNEKSWGPGDHLTVISKAVVYDAQSGIRLGYGEGLCTTREKKYAKRKQERACPNCGATAVIKGKVEYGGGWLCWKKRDGCGATYPDGDERIEGQQVGEVENPDLPDTWNTVIKMAEKRARVAAVLNTTGASALFTQDVEDFADEPPAPVAAMPPWTEQAKGELLDQTRKAIAALLGLPTPSHADVDAVLAKVADRADGQVPAIAARAIGIAAGAWKTAGAKAATEPARQRDGEAMRDQLDGAAPQPDDRPAPGALAQAPLEQRAKACTCAAGFEVAEEDPAAQDTGCPVHGIPF